MSEYRCLCMYCGKEWGLVQLMDTPAPICTKCGDSRVRVRKAGKRVDYYAGSESPPEKVIEVTDVSELWKVVED